MPWRLENSGLKWSLVIPDGPPATPLWDDRRFFPENSTSNWNGTSGSKSIISSGRMARGNAGRRLSSFNASNVAARCYLTSF